MNNVNKIGWQLLLLGLIIPFACYGLATWMNLTLVSREMIFVFTMFIPIALGVMMLYRRRINRRPEDNAWANDENFRRY